MANKKVKKTSKSNEKKAAARNLSNEPWISMRTGQTIIAITSIAMAILTAWEAIPSRGVVGGILLGILFGALIWAIFFGYYIIRRLLGPKG